MCLLFSLGGWGGRIDQLGFQLQFGLGLVSPGRGPEMHLLKAQVYCEQREREKDRGGEITRCRPPPTFYFENSHTYKKII